MGADLPLVRRLVYLRKWGRLSTLIIPPRGKEYRCMMLMIIMKKVATYTISVTIVVNLKKNVIVNSKDVPPLWVGRLVMPHG